MNNILDKLAMEIAWLIPKRLVYWCTIRLFAYASTNKWSNEQITSIPIDVALKRWTNQ